MILNGAGNGPYFLGKTCPYTSSKLELKKGREYDNMILIQRQTGGVTIK